jgi:hypothetical protein
MTRAAIPDTPGSLTPTDDPAAYRSSHLQLVRELDDMDAVPAGLRARGGIVVPAFRPFQREPGLELAAKLARHHDWQLLVVCSGQARAADFPGRLRAELGCRLTVLDIDGRKVPGPPLSSMRDPLVRLERSNDAAAKRNVGIAFAVRAGWRYLLFLDDDVSVAAAGPTLDEDGLRAAVGSLAAAPELCAVGWTVTDFPDNSVVGHARRLAEREQEIFVGSAALLVRCGPDLPFFPGVYNEDWMFLIALAQGSPRHRECIARGGTVRQLEYEPFVRSRAMSEEPGDIIAEGLMNLLEDDGPALWATAAGPAYWRRAMCRRAVLLEDLIRTFQTGPRTERSDRARAALCAALRIHRRTNPEALHRYVQGWRSDLPTWRSHLRSLAAPPPTADLATTPSGPPIRRRRA